MRVIPARIHSILDYLPGALLIVAPWFFGFADEGGAARWVPIVLGAGVILYSLVTRYELGLVGLLPMAAHLGLDAGGGLLEVGAALLTQGPPEREARTAQG